MGVVERLGQRIKDARERRGLSQAELAEAVQVTPSTISRIERGSHGPSWETLESITVVLGVRMAELFLGPDENLFVTSAGEETPEELRRRIGAALGVLSGRH